MSQRLRDSYFLLRESISDMIAGKFQFIPGKEKKATHIFITAEYLFLNIKYLRGLSGMASILFFILQYVGILSKNDAAKYFKMCIAITSWN